MINWILTPDIQFNIIDSVMEWSTLHPIPNMRLYLGILLGYILLFIPGLYAVMAKLKKLYYYKGVVIAGAALMAVFIFVLGRNTRFEDIFCYYVRLCIQEGDLCRDQVYMQLQSPYNGTMEVTLNGDYEVYVYDKEPVFDVKGDSYEIVREKGGDTLVSLTQLHSFEQRRLLLADDKRAPGEELTVSVTEETVGEWSGTITNHTDSRFVDVLLFVGGSCYYAEVLQAGEKLELSSLCRHEYSGDRRWNEYRIDSCGLTDSEAESAMNEAELASREARAKLLSEMFQAGYAPDTDTACLFGFVVNGDEQFLREQKEDITGYTLYRFDVEI